MYSMLTPPLEGEQLNGVSNGGVHVLSNILISGRVKSPPAK